jgi:SecD-like export protein
MTQSRNSRSVRVWSAVVLIGAAGTAVGLIGKFPWLGLIGGLMSIIGVPGLLLVQRASARSAPVVAADAATTPQGSERVAIRPDPARTARRGPARIWVWVGAAVVVAIGAAALVYLLRDNRPAKPVAAGVPLGFYLVKDVVPGACGSGPTSMIVPPGSSAATAPASAGASSSALEYAAADGNGCVRVSADGGFTVQRLEQVRVRDETDQGNDWTVAVTFRSQDAARFADLTGRLSVLPEPRNQLAIVLGSRMLSNPTVSDRISGDTAQIATHLTEAEAKGLASQLGAR